MKVAVFLSFATGVYVVYSVIAKPGNVRQGTGISMGILGAILFWQFTRELRAEKKRALCYWLGVLILSNARWIYVDPTFDLYLISLILIFLAVSFALGIVLWVRSGELT